MRRALVLIPLAVLIPATFARGGSLPTSNVLDDASFDHFYNLEYDQALAGFLARAAKAPASADVENHIAQTILFREMFRAGMLQSQMLTTSNSFLRMHRNERCSQYAKDVAA